MLLLIILKMVKAKNPDDLIFNKCIETNNNIYFTFKNNDNIVSINRNNYISKHDICHIF